MASPSEIPPDQLLAGKFRLLRRIGRGGMGDVWMARNEATQAEVAVKTLQKSERTSTHDERFRREARLAATISHRNVVRIFDLVDEPDGTLGLVMELLRGGTLEACVRERGPMTTMQAIAVAAPILSALNHVHEKGIVHRDVKPPNIFFAVEPDGHVIPKILDFGIAKLPAARSELTVDGSVLGTPHYMSPEQIRGQEDLDGRSDMFSLGVVLYELLTGVRVFQRDSPAASLAAVLEHQVDPDPRLEPRVWVAISRALAKRPYERFASCGEFANALRQAVEASEEELTQSLQELRPRSDAIPDSDSVMLDSLSASASASRARPRSRKMPGKGRVVLWTLAAAAAAAILAVTGTLVVTRSGPSQARAGDARQTPSTAPTETPLAPPAVVAPPEQASSPSTATPASTPTPRSTPVPSVKPTPLAAPRLPAPSAPRPTPPAKPPGSSRPVATSAGF